jgi:hypothetical protein
VVDFLPFILYNITIDLVDSTWRVSLVDAQTHEG